MSKFEKGDRVMATDCGKLGVVQDVDADGCVVLFDDGEDTWVEDELLDKSDEPPYDRKRDFLCRLQSLLRDFNACIMLGAKGSYCGDDVESVTMSVILGDDCIDYTITDFNTEITADNIMDYNKE